MNWFTDGGCIKNGEKDATAAYAIYGRNNNIEKAEILRGEYKTNQEAELMAILECIKLII